MSDKYPTLSLKDVPKRVSATGNRHSWLDELPPIHDGCALEVTKLLNGRRSEALVMGSQATAKRRGLVLFSRGVRIFVCRYEDKGNLP